MKGCNNGCFSLQFAYITFHSWKMVQFFLKIKALLLLAFHVRHSFSPSKEKNYLQILEIFFIRWVTQLRKMLNFDISSARVKFCSFREGFSSAGVELCSFGKLSHRLFSYLNFASLFVIFALLMHSTLYDLLPTGLLGIILQDFYVLKDRRSSTIALFHMSVRLYTYLREVF